MGKEHALCPKCQRPLHLSGTITFVCKANWFKSTTDGGRLVAWVGKPESTYSTIRCAMCDAYITSNYDEAARLMGAKEVKHSKT